MMRVVGFFAALLIAIAPTLALPDVHVFEAGAVAGLLCVAAALVPSLGLAVFGSTVALLVFATTLLLTPTPNAVFAALLLGLGLLILLNATQFEERFGRSEGKARIVGTHLSTLGTAVLLSIAASLAIAVGATIVAQDLDPSVRTVIAAFGGILVISAMMWKALL
jgi:hypothetical protein